MKQEEMDEMARQDYAWELQEIRIRKRKLNDPEYQVVGLYRDIYREDMLSEISFHKKQAEYFKRRVPMKPAKIEDDVWAITTEVCPCCKSRLKLYVNYCEDCGQRLMWE